MAVTHPITTQNAATNGVLALIGASGNLVFRTAGTLALPGTIVATLPFSATAFAAAADGVATANTITPDTNAAGNASPIATATLETAGGTIVAHCDVAETGSDINVTNGLVVNPGDTVACASLTYKALVA